MPFKFTPLKVPEVLLIEPVVFEDERGCFFETFKQTDFRKIGIEMDFLQDNQSESSQGVLRGLHYQLPPRAQAKIVRVVVGKVLDVVVDIRKSSPTFGKWIASELSGENNRLLFVPEGFAHGFLTLSESAVFAYKCTSEYACAAEAGIRWNDPDIGVEWPIEDVKVSDKDAALPYFASATVFD